MIDPKDVTIIIPHFGETKEQKDSISECLDSLEETTPNIQRIVVFNGLKCSVDECTLFVKDKWIEISDQGQCKAVNAAVAITNTPWIMVSNDDMIYPPGWFEKLVYALSPDVKCASPQLVEPRDGSPTFIKHFCGGSGGDFDKQKFFDFIEKPRSLELRTGFNLPFLMKRELWDLVGGYDINYDPWGSNGDSDLEYKIKLAGVQPYQNTACLVYHFSQTSGTFELQNQEYWHKNFAYFEQKWGFPRTDEGIWEATFEIPDEGRKFRPWWEGYYA